MPHRRPPYTFLAMVVTLAIATGLAAQDQPPGAEPAAAVRMTIRFSANREVVYGTIPYRPGMTIADAMSAARGPDGRKLKFDHKGKGATAFLIAIEDVANASGGSSDYWIFRVNEKLGTRSFGVTVLEPGDEVLWTFGKGPLK